MAAVVLRCKGLVPQTDDPRPAGATPALDLELARGSITCIIGPQGGGKTAYLRTLAAVDPPAAGDLSIAGNYCSGLSPEAWRKLRPQIAYIGPSAPLLSVLNALSNVTLPAHYHRIADPQAIHTQAEFILARLGYHGPLDVLPAYLDEHQRRLLALARCLILRPQILFIDEPFRMTDLGGWREFGRLFVRLAREDRLAQVIVTHHLHFVAQHADHIVFVAREGVRVFAGWEALLACPEQAVIDHLRATEASVAMGVR